MHVAAVLLMLLRDDHQPATKQGTIGYYGMTGIQTLPSAVTVENRLIAQSLDLVGDKEASPLVPLQVLLDLDLETRVSSSEVEEDSPSGISSSTSSAAAFLAAATTLGLSILT